MRVVKYENTLPASLVMPPNMSVCWTANGPKYFLKVVWNFCSPSAIFFSILIGIPALIVNRKNKLAFRKKLTFTGHLNLMKHVNEAES